MSFLKQNKDKVNQWNSLSTDDVFLDELCERKRPSAKREKSVYFPIYPIPLSYVLVANKYPAGYPAVYKRSVNRRKGKSAFIKMRFT